MAEVSNQFSIDEDEPMQTEPINLSSDEYTESHSSMSDQFLTVDKDIQYETVSQFVVHPNKPSGRVLVTIQYDDTQIFEPSLAVTASSGSQFTKNIHNVSEATKSCSPQSGPQPH